MSYEEICAQAQALGVEIITTQVLSVRKDRVPCVIKERKPGDLFRIDGMWYHLVAINGKVSCVTEVGDGLRQEISMPSNTKIDQVSVLSLV